MKKLIYDGEKYEELEVIGLMRVKSKMKGDNGELYDCVEIKIHNTITGNVSVGLAISVDNRYKSLPEDSSESDFIWEMVEVYNEFVWEKYEYRYKAVKSPEELDDYLLDNKEIYTTKYLPIGSVVELDNCLEIMIVAVDPTKDNYYIGCKYPEGILTDVDEEKYITFADPDITSLLFSGYVDEEEKRYKHSLEEQTENHTR